MSPNDADGMANSVDPDQTAPLGAVWSGSALFAQAYLSENLGSLRWYPCFSGIIYTFSKKESEDVTAELQSRGIKAGCYHADLSAQQRSFVHRNWLSNKIQVSEI